MAGTLRPGINPYLPILKTFVPQFGHVPFVAGFPFFSFVFTGFFISIDFLHFTQYALDFSGVRVTLGANFHSIIKKHRDF